MSEYSEYFIINLYIEDRNTNINPSEISFSMVDSIYDLYSYCVIEYNDLSGLVQEYLGTLQGTRYKLEYGTRDTLNSCTYVIQRDNLNDVDQPGYISGKDNIFAVHEWWNKQTISNIGYKDRISGVVTDLASKYLFNLCDINDTGNDDYWYQTNMTDAKFIKDVLVPNAFSRNSSGTPFYCFTTTNNEFHFRHADSMIHKEVAATLEYIYNPGTNDSGAVSQKNKISLIKRWSTNPNENWNLRKRKIFRISRDTGLMEQAITNTTSHPPKNNLDFPVIESVPILLTGVSNVKFAEDTIVGLKENVDGQDIHAYKNGFFQDHFMVMIPFDPTLHAGKSIRLKLYTKNKDNESKRFSGLYVIEQCDHIWNGEEIKGYTKLILGRKYIQIPSSYLLKPKLIQ